MPLEEDRPHPPLSERLRADLRAWAEANAHDPGIALLELFAYLADALGSMEDEVAREGSLTARRYLSVRLQQGRVSVDTDWNEGTPGPPRWGLYRGTVVSATDPLAKSRVQVEVPSVAPGAALWAMPCLDPGGPQLVPAVGVTVWVAYEEGDADRPVWLGVVP